MAWTGGGSAGHVLPNVSLIQACHAPHYHFIYLGQAQAIEQSLLRDLPVKFLAIRSGKLRRYFSFKTLIEPFNILIGIGQSLWYLYRHKPALVFSKGGFVAFPVVVAAWLLRIPVWVHESDVTPGLANRLCFPLAKKIFVAFDTTQSLLTSATPSVVSGIPLRAALYTGDPAQAKAILPFNWKKPVLLFIGGSLGAKRLNAYVWRHVLVLCQKFHVIHVHGRSEVDFKVEHADYYGVNYLDALFPHVLALANLVVTRSGANTIFELLALGKPCVLVPLPKTASRGEQLANALYCQKHYGTLVVEEADLDAKLWDILQHYDLSRTMLPRDCLDGVAMLSREINHQLNAYGSSKTIR